MFRNLRRKDKELTEAEALKIIEEGIHRHWAGIVTVNGDDGYPYAVPVTYAYKDKKIYFHSAKTGHKIDSIADNPKVCFCVTAKNDMGEESFIGSPSSSETPIESQNYTHIYQSALAFGRAHIINDGAESMSALKLLVEQRTPDCLQRGMLEIERRASDLVMVEIDIEFISGKGIRDKSLVIK